MNIDKLNIWFDELIEPIRCITFLSAFVLVLVLSILLFNDTWQGLVLWLVFALCYRLPYLKKSLK
jgi:hypothetical protein